MDYWISAAVSVFLPIGLGALAVSWWLLRERRKSWPRDSD